MARRIIKLSDFDPQPIVEYAITEHDLTEVYYYLNAIQSHLAQETWAEICVGGYYSTSILLHWVIEVRFLLHTDPYLLIRNMDEIKALVQQPQNRIAHYRGLAVEYTFLQKVIHQIFNQRLDIGALVLANTQDRNEWDNLPETHLSFHNPSFEEIEAAKHWLFCLRNMPQPVA